MQLDLMEEFGNIKVRLFVDDKKMADAVNGQQQLLIGNN